jgi:hypothetical protein
MPRCDACGTTILFGGVRSGSFRFCNDRCRQQSALVEVAERIPPDALAEHAAAIHAGNCPKCGGPGPVDVHTSHTVWSALYLTSWNSKPQVCCRGCGMKAKLGGAAFSGIFGWWGFPFGLIITPIQVFRNLGGLLRSPDPGRPSPELEKMVRTMLAGAFLEEQQRHDEQQPGGPPR